MSLNSIAIAFGLGLATAELVRILVPRGGKILRKSVLGPEPETPSDKSPAVRPSSGNNSSAQETSSSPSLPRVSKTSPHPDWQIGQPQPHPFGPDAARLALDPDVIDGSSLYVLSISTVVPRPIAFISSEGADGSKNLAPYSYFNILQHNPPIIAIGPCRSSLRGGDYKDSHRNILETGECVISIISEWFIEAANHTCGDFAPGVDEKALAGLTPLPSLKVKPAGVAESACNLECRLIHKYDTTDKRTGKPSGSILLLEVVMFRLLEGATMKSPSGKVVMDPVKMLPMARLGGNTYSCIAGMFDLPRPHCPTRVI